MKDYIEIGPAPADEECAQLGEDGYYTRSRRECWTYIKQIRRELGMEPANTKLVVKTFQHDFGTYYEVVCYYGESYESMGYAIRCEEEVSDRWDDESKEALGLVRE